VNIRQNKKEIKERGLSTWTTSARMQGHFFWHNPKGGFQIFQITCSETKETTKFEPRDAYKFWMLLANGNGYVHDAVAQA